MTKSRTRRSAVLAIALVVGCEGGGPRSGDGQAKQVVLSGSDSFPCMIEFEPTGVTLRSDLAGTVPDPMYPVALGPDGRFYTSTPPGSGSIAVWSETGEFIGIIGRLGEGPGDLGTVPYAKVDDTGIVHIFSLADGRWQRFTPDGEFISLARPRSSAFGITWEALVVLSPDSVLSSAPIGERQFRIFDAAGTLVKAFGRREPGSGDHRRPIASTSSGTFWAAPRPGDESGYLLEEWSIDGSLVRQVTRAVPWWPTPAEVMASASDEWIVPRFQLYAGEHGHLVLIIWVRWPTPGSDGEGWFEVIDPVVPEVLASRKFVATEVGAAGAPPMWNIFPGTQRGIFGRTEDATGLPVIDMMRYRLEPNTEFGAEDGRADRCSY